MPYCPKCLTEYVEGTNTCVDCNAALVPGSPPESQSQEHNENVGKSRLVTVRIFASGPTALLDIELARKLLDSHGIPSLVTGEISAELLPLDIPLLVREEDSERAASILHDYLDTQAPPAAE